MLKSDNNRALKGKSLFIVGSPFQCICMLEAIHYYSIVDYNVIVNSDDVNYMMVSRLMECYNIKFTHKRYRHIFFDLLPLIFRKKVRYDNIFLGNFYALTYRDYAVIHAKFNASFYIMDDGIQALEIFSEHKRKVDRALWVKIVQTGYELLGCLKNIKSNNFFTIYDVYSDKYNIIKNPFSLLSSTTNSNKKGVYVISTNSSVVQFKNFKYETYLELLKTSINNRFGDVDIYFCPHRRDHNNDFLQSLCGNLGFKWFNTQISIEVDLIQSNVYPLYIVGFNSNALYTLKKIFKDSIVETLMYHLVSERSDNETAEIRIGLNNFGIPTLNLTNE